MANQTIETAYAWARDQYAELGVDTENATGALHLYELLGFKTTRRRLTQMRELT